MPTPPSPSVEEAFRQPLNAAHTMRDFPYSWCICGGWAIDIFLKRVSRVHKDVDIAIWRRDQLALRSYLIARNWTLEKAVAGQLFAWLNNEFIELPVHTIWCRNSSNNPNFIEILFNEVNDNYFLFRRALNITYPLESAIITSELGIPILAPEIVLLYKAKNASNKENQHDFEVTLPYLNDVQSAWLKDALLELHPNHEWLDQLYLK